MVKLFTYFSVSSALLAATVYYAYVVHEQFYPTVVYLTNNKLCILSLGNFGFCFALTMAHILIRVFFTEIADDETNELMQRSKYSMTEICIALTSFRHELNKTVVILFVALLFLKAFHWLTMLRIEHFQRGTQQQPPPQAAADRLTNAQFYTKCRLLCMLLFLLCVDVSCCAVLSYLLYQQRRFSVLVLFAFECAILSASILTQLCKFVILLVDCSYGDRGWPRKPCVMFVCEFLHDLVHLFLYAVFIWILSVNWGFPLHLLRELFLAFHSLRTRVVHFYHYRKIIRVLDTQFATVTRQQLLDSQRDVVCVICFAEMEHGKELPCRHVFHLSCLKRWFEQKQECPMCRLRIVPSSATHTRPPPMVPLPPRAQPAGQPAVQPHPSRSNEDDAKDERKSSDDDDDDDEEEEYDDIARTPWYSYQNPYAPHMHPAAAAEHSTHSQYGAYSYPYAPYPSAAPMYSHAPYPHAVPPPPYMHASQSQSAQDANHELQQLTHSTLRLVEYHEMCASQLKLALEHYATLQSKWKQQDANDVVNAHEENENKENDNPNETQTQIENETQTDSSHTVHTQS